MFPLLLILGVAAVITIASTSSAASSSQASVQQWPPGPQLQAMLAQQYATYYSNATGEQLDMAQVNALFAQFPAAYQAQLPPGTQPTIAGYQAWVASNYVSGMQAGGNMPGYGEWGQPGTNWNPAWSQVSGPLYPVFYGFDENTTQPVRMYQDLDGNFYLRS